MGQTKTDEGLLRALREASSRKLTEKEIQAQRVSFIMSAVDKESGVTTEKVREILARQEGRKVDA